jgi:hypothetical protein
MAHPAAAGRERRWALQQERLRCCCAGSRQPRSLARLCPVTRGPLTHHARAAAPAAATCRLAVRAAHWTSSRRRATPRPMSASRALRLAQPLAGQAPQSRGQTRWVRPAASLPAPRLRPTHRARSRQLLDAESASAAPQRETTPCCERCRPRAGRDGQHDRAAAKGDESAGGKELQCRTAPAAAA